MPLTHRERVIKAINHEEPDRVPIDVGGSRATGISAEAYIILKKYLEIEGSMRKFASETGIPFSHLDLLWWSEETGEIFK